jgi:hypothetical protein
MIDKYVIDFNRTFGGAMLLLVEEKMQREHKDDPKSNMVQAQDNGVLKWTITLAVQTKLRDKSKLENIQVTIVSPNKPYEAIPPGTAVTCEGLEVGIMPQQRGGFSVFYSCEAIRPLQPPRIASAQPQPARGAAGQ